MAQEPAVVHVRVADAEPLRSFIDGVAGAVAWFSDLADDDLAALPDEVSSGIAELRKAAGRLAGDELPPALAADVPPRGQVIIEWPPLRPDQPVTPGCLLSILDAGTGQEIRTATVADVTIHADAAELVTADLVLFCDEEGRPLYDGMPAVKDGAILTAAFRYVVAGMRVRDAG